MIILFVQIDWGRDDMNSLRDHFKKEFEEKVFCAFTTNMGGMEKSSYGNFNLAEHVHDDIQRVNENRARLNDNLKIGEEDVFYLNQQHTNKVFEYKKGVTKVPIADAVITSERLCPIAVLTADCVPLLIYDHDSEVVAAIHAGWRGIISGIIENTLALMKANYKTRVENVYVNIGPAISSSVYEVGEELKDLFRDKVSDECVLFRNESWYVDLVRACKEQLLSMEASKDNIYESGICTYTSSAFYSARKWGLNSGRFASVIMIL